MKRVFGYIVLLGAAYTALDNSYVPHGLLVTSSLATLFTSRAKAQQAINRTNRMRLNLRLGKTIHERWPGLHALTIPGTLSIVRLDVHGALYLPRAKRPYQLDGRRH